jgi:SWI/SNF-related matrix-associated actin-dependent regulator of chromatin subfamily A3
MVACKVVGINYYRGLATLDENLLLVREPRNAYDSNAIRVDNVANLQVGQYPPSLSLLSLSLPLFLHHSFKDPRIYFCVPSFSIIDVSNDSSIPRDMAAILAPLLDSGNLTIEGTVVGHRNSWNIPISIQLFSLATQLPQIQSTLLRRGLDIKPYLVSPNAPRRPLPPPVPEYTSASPPATRRPDPRQFDVLLQNSVSFDPRSLRDAPEKFGLSVLDLEKLPLATQPPQVKTKMLQYQLQGLRWMMEMEHPRLPESEGQVKQFWTRSGGNWLNIASNLYVPSKPVPSIFGFVVGFVLAVLMLVC